MRGSGGADRSISERVLAFKDKCPVVLLTQPVTAPLAAPPCGHFYEKNVMEDGQGSKTFGILLLANSAVQEEFAFP